VRIQSLYDRHLSFPDYDGYWDTHNLEETERQIRSRLPIGAEVVTPDQVEALTQAARVFCLQGKVKEARNFLLYAESLLKGISAEDAVKAQVRYHLEEGRVYCLSMYPSRALESFKQAWELSAGTGKFVFFAIDAAHMISITLPVKQGRDWLQRAVALAEKSENRQSSLWLPYLYMENGWLAFDINQFDSALAWFEKADRGLANNQSLKRTLKWCKARALRAAKKYTVAVELQKEIFLEMSELGESNGHVSLEMAECYKLLNQEEEASTYFKLAYEKLKVDKWFSENYTQELSVIQKNSKKKTYQ
jgi:tetratricopeptide (TPR) repeat protein